MAKQFYGKGLPGIDTSDLRGTLIVIEGGDGAGRSTQVQFLREWLERRGFPTSEFGLKRSALVGKELSEAMEGNTLGPLTFSLFYATDFADQLENSILPALRAGFVVIADRYFFTPMARDIVRGVDKSWVMDMYGFAPVPDLIVQLKVRPKVQAERIFEKSGVLDYWESGMDIQRSGDMYQCFVKYQDWIRHEYQWMAEEYSFKVVDGNRDPRAIHREIQEIVSPLLTVESPKIASRKIVASKANGAKSKRRSGNPEGMAELARSGG